jgi:hypothetical protein
MGDKKARIAALFMIIYACVRRLQTYSEEKKPFSRKKTFPVRLPDMRKGESAHKQYVWTKQKKAHGGGACADGSFSSRKPTWMRFYL